MLLDDECDRVARHAQKDNVNTDGVPDEATERAGRGPRPPDQKSNPRGCVAVEEEPRAAVIAFLYLVTPYLALNLNPSVAKPTQHIAISKVKDPEANTDHEYEYPGAQRLVAAVREKPHSGEKDRHRLEPHSGHCGDVRPKDRVFGSEVLGIGRFGRHAKLSP
jgi:hypothetical protein